VRAERREATPQRVRGVANNERTTLAKQTNKTKQQHEKENDLP